VSEGFSRRLNQKGDRNLMHNRKKTAFTATAFATKNRKTGEDVHGGKDRGRLTRTVRFVRKCTNLSIRVSRDGKG